MVQKKTILIIDDHPLFREALKVIILRNHSPRTFENHRSNIFHKLNIHSTIEIVRYAARLGIIDVDLWE